MTVQILNDFITKERAEAIVSLLDPVVADTPRDGIKAALGFGNPKMAADVALKTPANIDTEDSDVTDSIKAVLEETKSFYEVENDEVCLVNAFYYNMEEGSMQQVHCDTCEIDGSPLEDSKGPEFEPNKWSAILYLNNHGEDYEGGEIWFPKESLIHEPKLGDLVHFKADVDHPHGVKQVISGNRKCIVFFMGYYSEAIEDEATFSDR